MTPNSFHICLFHFLHVSSKLVLIIRRIIVSIQHLVCVTLCRWPSSMQIGKFLPDLRTGRSPTQSDTYQMYWYNWFSWWWARVCSKNVENWNKHIGKELCVKLAIYKKDLTFVSTHFTSNRWDHFLNNIQVVHFIGIFFWQSCTTINSQPHIYLVETRAWL
jgi:hypothetical protein